MKKQRNNSIAPCTKERTTKPELLKTYPFVIKIPHNALQTLLSKTHPCAYRTSEMYGWLADVYKADAAHAIVTGYTPCGNVAPAREVINRYETKAKGIVKKYGYPATCREKLNELLKEFVMEVCNNEV